MWQFRFLKRLLLVHGHWNYDRMCKAIKYVLYKNCLIAIPLFFYGFWNWFSSYNFYEDYLYTCYNIFLFFPVIAVGVFDQDVPARALLRYPKLYSVGQKNSHMGFLQLTANFLVALFHSLLIFFIPFLVINEWADSGEIGSSWVMGTSMVFALVFLANTELWCETVDWQSCGMCL